MTQAAKVNITNLLGRTRLAGLSNRRTLIGGVDARVITASDEAPLLRLWREKRGEAEPDNLTGNAGAKPSTSPALAAHAALVIALSAHPPRMIPLDADALDLEGRADHLTEVFNAFSVYLTVILDDTAQNVPGSLDLSDAEAVLVDLAADVTGAIQQAADSMAGRVAWSPNSMPFNPPMRRLAGPIGACPPRTR
jgi:hypothetical protein